MTTRSQEQLAEEQLAEQRIAEAARTGAIELDLSGLKLVELPDKLFDLTHLQHLNLNTNHLGVLPDAIARLTELRSLLLRHNSLGALTKAIGRLTQLQSLNLDFNQLTALPEEIGRLTQLEKLDLTGNQLREVPAAVGRLVKLRVLFLNDNLLSTLPETIGYLARLETLDLSQNKLSELPETIGGLANLTVLYLYDNRLTVLPEALRSLSRLQKLYLHANERLSIPPDVLGPNWRDVAVAEAKPARPADILAFYFRSRAEEKRPLGEAKILVVGQGAVGKTSLVKRLVADTYDPNEPMTEGIDITRWDVPWDQSDEPVRVNVWDFGGQEILHATHQFFLTTRSLYMVVLDARKGEDESRLHYWLKLVQSYGADSPIIIVVNKSEPPHHLDLNETRLRQDYAPGLIAFAKVSCATGDGIAGLKQLIEDQIRVLSHIGDPMPVSFFDLKRDLEERAVDYLTFADYQSACREHGIADEREQRSFLRILHVLGSMLNYDDPNSPFALRDTNVLKPDWVTDGVYRILNSNALMKAGGVLEVAQLGDILTDHVRFPPQQHQFLIEMMRKFELCFDFPESSGLRLLVPELLSSNEPDLNWPDEGRLDFEYHYNVLPSGLICRFIVKMHGYLTPKPTYWRSGVVLAIEGNKAFVRADVQANRIYVSVIGLEAARRSALAVIRHALREIHGTISKLEAVEKVPLPEDRGVLLDYRELRALEQKGIREYPVMLRNGEAKMVAISSLLDGVTSPETRMAEQQQEERLKVEKRHRPDPPPGLGEQPQHMQPTWERIAIFGVGIVFVATLLAIALFVPNPTDFQLFTFRVVLAIAAGALGALIPGFLDVTFKNWLRAGGAMALFVIVYMINPPALVTGNAGPPTTPPAVTEKLR